MLHAYGNLVDNTLYQDLTREVNNHYTYKDQKLIISEGDLIAEYESCFYCHGTKVEVKGFVELETDYGKLEFPDLKGWPNQSVGRINPDGSKGVCTSCQSRHAFSIEMSVNRIPVPYAMQASWSRQTKRLFQKGPIISMVDSAGGSLA